MACRNGRAACRVTVKNNAEYAQQANQSASGTRDVADRGGPVVAKAVGAMARIEESSRKISEIIDEIARQTSLLALNAAVESTRACAINGAGVQEF